VGALPYNKIRNIRVVVGDETLVVIQALAVRNEVRVLEHLATALHGHQLDDLILLGAMVASFRQQVLLLIRHALVRLGVKGWGGARWTIVDGPCANATDK
jgi:hypothetical protein